MSCTKFGKAVDTDELINKTEDSFNIKIPKETAQFLKLNSRGVPVIKQIKQGEIQHFITRFLSLDPKDKINILTVALILKDDIVDQTFIPFATDGFGNYYGLCYNNGFLSSVGFYDSEKGEIQYVCNHFEQIIKAICF